MNAMCLPLADDFFGTTVDWSSAYHTPVLATEVLAFLGSAHRVLDCTVGGGGHTAALIDAGVREVVGIDRDAQAIAATRGRLAGAGDRLNLVQANYADVADLESFAPSSFGGILLDLGISSHQIDDPARGFSFRPGAPLDMRMGADAPRSAAEWLNEADEQTLMTVFREYGDEHRAPRLAREIGRRRANRAMAVSDDLVDAIRGALGARTGPPDFARLFQAVRIAVNDELSGLERALPALRELLEPSGRLVVIAYHSGEDRIVKGAFREWSADCICPPRQPICTCRGRPLGKTLTKRAVTASEAEVTANPRARSARLRAWERA